MSQLPPEVAPVAGAVLAYSFVCLLSGFFLLWMVWIHDERKSYISMLGAFVTLHTLASIIQQIHTIARWRDIKTEQWENTRDNAGNPELNITGASTGLDLVLFYIQYYSYNVEGLLVLFWAVELLNSIFRFSFIRAYRIHASMFAKIFAIVLPAVQMVLLRFSAIQSSTISFMVLADCIMIVSFGGGATILFAILVRYIHSRLTLAQWTVGYGRSSGGASGTGSNARAPRKPSIYDRWLVLRFTIAFIALSIFQLVVINYQIRAAGNNRPDTVPPEPDLSIDRAKGDFTLFAPGPTAVLFIFLVFGTTRTFRQTMWNLFIPRSIRDKVAERERQKQLQRRGDTTGGSATIVQPGSHDPEIGGGSHLGVPSAIKLRDMGPNSGNVSDGKSDEFPIMKSSPTGRPWQGGGGYGGYGGNRGYGGNEGYGGYNRGHQDGNWRY